MIIIPIENVDKTFYGAPKAFIGGDVNAQAEMNRCFDNGLCITIITDECQSIITYIADFNTAPPLVAAYEDRSGNIYLQRGYILFDVTGATGAGTGRQDMLALHNGDVDDWTTDVYAVSGEAFGGDSINMVALIGKDGEMHVRLDRMGTAGKEYFGV